MQTSDIIDSLKSYPIAWGAGLLSLVTAVYLYLSWSSLSELETKLAETEREVSVLSTNAIQGVGIEEDFQRYEQLFEQVNGMLLDHSQIANNNGFFYDFAADNAVDITDVSQRPVIKESAKPATADIWRKKHYSVIPFSMEVKGLLTQIIEMFYLLDQTEHFVQVRSFELTTSSTPEVGYMGMKMEVNVLGKPVEEKK